MPNLKVEKKKRSLESLINISESECELIDSIKRKKNRINTVELDAKSEFKKTHKTETMDSDCQRNALKDNSGNKLSSQCGDSTKINKPEGSECISLTTDHEYHKEKKHKRLKIKNDDKFSCDKYLDNSFKNINGLQNKTSINDWQRVSQNMIDVVSSDVKEKNSQTPKKKKHKPTVIATKANILPKKKKHKKKACNFQENIIKDSNSKSYNEDKKSDMVNSDEHKVSKRLDSVNVSESECEIIDSVNRAVNLSSKKEKTEFDNNYNSKKKHKRKIMNHFIEDNSNENTLVNEYKSKKKKPDAQIENNVTSGVGNHYVENVCHENCKKKRKHSKKCKLYISKENKSLENEYILITVTPTGIKKHIADNSNNKHLDLSIDISENSSEIIEVVNSPSKKKKKQKTDTKLETSDVPTKKLKRESDVHENRENDDIQIENNIASCVGSHYIKNVCHENCKKKQKHSKKCILYLNNRNSSLENEYISITVTPHNSMNENSDLSTDISGTSCEIIEVVNSSSEKKKKRKPDAELDTSNVPTKKHKKESDIHENKENDGIKDTDTKFKLTDQTETKTSVSITLHDESESLKVEINSPKSAKEKSLDNLSIKDHYNFSVLCLNEKVEDSGHESYNSNLDNDLFSDNSDLVDPKLKSKKYKKPSIEHHSTANNSLVLTENSCEPQKVKTESFVSKAELSPVTKALKQSYQPQENSFEKIKKMSVFAEYITNTEGFKIKEEPLGEMSTDSEEYEEEKQKLLNLHVIFPFPISRLHEILTRTTKPTKEQLQTIKDLNIPVKNGLFSKQEDEKIIENWKELCRTHDLKLCPAVFIKFPNRVKTETKVNILRYIGHGLDDRLLDRIYIRFKRLLLKNHQNMGRFTPEEDKQIIKYMEETKSSRPFSDLSKLLNRHSLSIEKRYDLLAATNKGTIRWTPKKVDKFVKAIMKVTKCEKLEDLKDKDFTTKEWRKLSKKMDGIPIKKLHRAWKVTIHPRLFSEDVNLKEMKEEIIRLLYDGKETDWRTVNWKEIAKHFKGFTAEKVYMMFKHLVYVYVPTCRQKNLKECLDFLKNTFLRYEQVGTPHKLRKFVFKKGSIALQ